MASLSETPSSNRLHIAFFGLRNAGKSTLVNAFCNQELAIVSAVPGTTTDPVSKAMEILPLGPCMITDTAGLDDIGELGEMRVKKTLDVLASTDVAIWVEANAGDANAEFKSRFLAECCRRDVVVLEYRRGEDVDELKRRIAGLKIAEEPKLLDGLVKAGDRVICICPIDSSAPKGRLILPQQQVIRECLDLHAIVTVCQPENIPAGDFDLAITDSQAFASVGKRFTNLTSFSILFARQKGDLAEYERGLEAIGQLKDGDIVLVAEACSHHRQCNDIGTTKIPKAVEALSGAKVRFIFASGSDFASRLDGVRLVVHCGACMLTRRMMQSRIALVRERGIPIVNYGMLLHAAANRGGDR